MTKLFKFRQATRNPSIVRNELWERLGVFVPIGGFPLAGIRERTAYARNLEGVMTVRGAIRSPPLIAFAGALVRSRMFSVARWPASPCIDVLCHFLPLSPCPFSPSLRVPA